MSPLQIGIIGYGNFGRFLHQAWQRLPDIAVTAVSKRSLEPGSLGKITVYNNWLDLIADQSIDIAVICTPPADHARMACAAMEAGKHVLIEKPLATTAADAQRVIEAQNKMGKMATVNHLLRFNPIVEALVTLAKEGPFGPLRRAIVENYAGDQGLPEGHWFWDSAVSGGILVEHGVHFIDLVNQLTGESVRQVMGFSQQRQIGLEDRVMADAIYGQGLIATHFHSFSRPSHFEATTIRLVFDLAQIEVSGWVPLKGRVEALVNESGEKSLAALPNLKIYQNEDAPGIARSSGISYWAPQRIAASFELSQPKQIIYADCARKLLTDLITRILNPDHNLRVSLSDALQSLEIACLARRSASEGHILPFVPAERF